MLSHVFVWLTINQNTRMARTTLPRSTESGAAQAAAQLQQLINDPLSVTMLVFGEGPDVAAALALSEGRASVKPSIRLH